MIRRVCIQKYMVAIAIGRRERQKSNSNNSEPLSSLSIIVFALLLSSIKYIDQAKNKSKSIVYMSLNCLRYSRLIFYRKQKCQSKKYY